MLVPTDDALLEALEAFANLTDASGAPHHRCFLGSGPLGLNCWCQMARRGSGLWFDNDGCVVLCLQVTC